MTTTIHVGGKEVPPAGPARPSAAPTHLTAPAGGLLSEAPAVSRRGWLPDETPFEGMDELRNEHVRLLDLAAEVGREIAAVEARHASEDERHAAALREQVLDPSVKLPKLTPPEKRAAELKPLRDKAKAIHEARETFTVEAVAEIGERFEEWSDELDAREGEVQRRVEEARAALAEVEAAVGGTLKLRRWLERTAGRHPRFKQLDGRHIAYAELPTPPVTSAPSSPREVGVAFGDDAIGTVNPRPLASAFDRQQELAERARRDHEREEQ